MAERPLYTLYKNLKAQNYDVPDDYNKFESALTRDGKGGADNRHAIYENLKAQNFDVPSTYERFYSALFEPRSKTSSRAKGGSVPMSAADRARFSAGAAAISASAQQTMNNAVRYNRLKQRKQKQQKDFGRVNLGTHQTPYGGDANNVVKDDFAYNPETGKTGAYVTSDNENVYSQNDAEQKQNLLDKYGEEWNNAVDMGIVPSELDKADPDLSDTDVAMRQMERRQEWLNENQDRRSKELNESMHLQGSPFVASGGAVAPSSFNTVISNEANRLSDVEYGAYNTAKAYNQMLRTTLLQELKEQKQRNENAGWWKDKWNDVSNYFGAMFNTMLDPKLYSQGVMDAAISNNLLQVKKGMEYGTIKKGSNAGNAAQAMLGAIQQQQGEAAKQQQYGSKAYLYGDISGRSLKFMADFALSGWRNVMTTGFTKAGEKVGEKMALGALGKWFTKNTGRVLGDIAGSAALAATNQLGSTYNNVIERYVGMNNENGGVTQDKNGDLKFNEGVSLGKAIKDGFGSATIENFSEMFGEYLPGASKLLAKLGLSKVSSFFENIGNNAYYKWLSNATNKSGIQGVMAEISEEEFGTALHAAWGDGDGSWSDFNVFTNPDAREKQIDTCLGMFYSVGFMQAPRTAVGAINAVRYFNIKHQVAKADKFGQMMFNDKWDEIKSKIDVTTNADLTKTVLDATRSDSMTAKQKGAVINYAMFLSKLRGFNQAADAKTKDKVEEGDTAPTLSNDLDDAYTEGHNADDTDKHNIQLEQNDKANELAAMLHITPEQLHDMADEDLETMTGQNDKLDQAIYDYQVSTAKYQGVMDGAQDEVDMAAHQAAMETDNMTDLSRGTVRKATIKATGGLEDYEVYIISGNIATHDDGSIDVGNSDDMIIYYDPTTGRKEHADAMMFADLIEELPAADVKAQAINDAKENAIKKIAGVIDGTVEVGSQFSVTDADGTEHTYEVLADNGDGTAMITIDGNVPTELVKGENVQIPYSFADLQQMKDMEDQKRLEAAKTEREQMEKEHAAQQTQETEQTQPSFDFNQILNDDGNVVLVDVLDKDGNTKYPNSQLFLIRDSGAKAKVVELKSDGTLVPHAVNKKDVRTATTMTLDEYKQAFAESSMIEENSGAIEVEDNEEGKLLNRNDDGAQTEQNQPSASVTTSQEDAAGSSESKDKNISANGNKNNESLTFEDGTPIPVDVNGEVDLSQTDAFHAAEWYDNNLGEDADDWLDGEIKKAKKVLEQAKNKKLTGSKPSELVASKKEKEAAIADAQAHYDSAISIRDSLKERRIAKEENTSEGRRNLIEKSRRKFARLKSAVKDDAEAVSQLYRETIGSLLHRLYDGTGIDVTDTIPLTAEEYVASNLGAHSLNYEGTETSKGVKQETGLSREDFAKTQLLAADGKGTTIDALVHSLWENRPSNLESLDTQDIRNALIGVLNSGFKASEARNFVENIRIAQAENILEEQKRAQENAAYAEQHKAEPEAELKAKSDEKAELKAKSEEKLDNESSNESNDLSNESDNEKINDNINDNINTPEVPEDATDEKPLGEQRTKSPFLVRENGKQQTETESDADVEKNKVDDIKVVDNIVGKKTRKTLEKIAKIMGANIQWLYSNKQFNGRFDEKTNTIYLTLDSSITEGVQFIFGHEMTHEMRTKNPAVYGELKTLVKDMMGEDAFNSETDNMQKRYKKGGARYWNDRNAIEEEVVADQLGIWIRDANYAHTLLLKMSHPLLARLHEIVNSFLMALHGTEFSDDMRLILRSIEQAYVKTANGQVTNSETGEDVSFSLRQKPEPKKKGIGYKVFVLKDGKLYPPMVANPDGAATPVGVWLDADAAPIAGESKTGRPQVKQGGKGTQGGSGKLAYRPGWHLGVVPYAIQFNRKDAEGNKTLFPKNFVFAEVEYAADVDYQEEARQEGINPSGKYQHSLAGLKHLPTDGYYMYRTNPNPETDPWVITGAMKVNRILTRAEQAELVKNAGREPQQIQEGDIVTDDIVNSINQEIAYAPKFSLKVYHGSGADFTEFDFDHMGEGAGSQAFGWGGYVTSSEEIGKSYVELTRKKPTYVYNGKEMSEDDLRSVLLDKVGIDNANILDDFLYNLEKYGVSEAKSILRKGDYAYFKDLLKGTYGSVRSGYQNKVDAAELILAPRNIRVKKYKGNLYEVDIPDDNGRNYLDWDAPITDELIDKVAKVLPSLRSYDIKDLKKDRTFDNFYKTISMRSVKDDASFNDDKAASKLLSSLGYTGIKYKAGRNFGGAEEGDTNYVIFKPEDMRITEHTKFSLKKVNDAFNQRLDELVKNPNQKDKILRLGRSSSFLKAGGIADADIELEFDKFVRKSGDKYKNNHPFNASDLKNLPMAIAEPIAVFKSTNANDHVVLTELQKDGKNFIVAIRAVEQHRKGGVVLEVNKITSLYPKEEKGIINWVNTGRISNVDKEKALHFIEALQPHAGTSITDEELKSAANIINSFETTKENGEKVDSDGTKFSLKDEEYLKAVEDGNMEKAQKMVNEAADAAGYSTDSSYQGTSAFNGAAPWGNGYFLTKDERKEAWDNGEFEGESTLGDYINDDIDGGNLEELTNAASYRAADPMRKDAIDNVRNAIQKKANTITMYRSVPSDVKEGSFRNGDWVTPSRAYAVDNAKLHGWGDDYNIIEQKVPVDDVWFDGNDIAEWGYGREEDYINDTDFAYKNSKNNKKLLDAVTYDDNGNVIPLSQRFNEKNNDVRFSLKDEKTMFGMHNISVDKLRKAIKQGGFAAPSMGVVDSKNGIYSDYGEITLIPKAEKLAKRTGKNAGTFTADAWTPTYPQVERIMNKQGEKAFNTDMNVKLGDVDNGIYSNVRESWKGYLSSGDVRVGLYWHYLFDKGMNPETIYQTGKYDNDITNEVMRISDNGNKTDYTDKEVAELIQLMNKATGKDNDVDAQREKLKARIASAEKQGKHLLVALKKKRLEELEGVENFYIAADFVNDVVRNNRKNGKVDVHDTMGAAKKKVEDNKKLSDDFPSWLDKKTEEYGVEEMLYNGTTPSGKPKYIPNTIDNAVKLMKKQGVAGGYTAFGSELGVFIAKNSPEVNTLAAMKNAKDKLIPFGDERHNQIKDKITKEFLELSDEIRVGSNNRYAFDDSGVSRMVELTDNKGNEKEYLKKAYNVEVSDEWMDRYNKLLDTIKKDYKVFYFETKFMRPYGLDEFEKAIVPNDTPSDVVDALKNAGIDVSSYERGNAEDRQKVTMDAINSSDNIRFSLKSMMEKPEGWKQANKKAIHIAEAIERDPKFSLKSLDGTLIKAGTYFSGGGLVEEGLKGIIDPVVAVEYDEKISGVYRNNFGQHIVTADVRDVDPRELVKQIDGEVEYFHASPVCKNYSQAKSNHAEVELDKETAASTAEFINAIKPKVVTIENVKGYKDSEAMKTITDALDANGYTWDADVYNAADYGGYTNRERLIVRAVRDGKLPEKPKKMARKSGWYEAVADIIPTLTEKKNGVAPWMDIRLKADGIDWRNIDKPLYVMGSAYADGKVPHAFADELLPTLRTKSGDVIVMPDGKVYRAMGRVLARVSGVSDDYKMPFSENLSHTIIGNGIPTQLTEHVIAPLLQNTLRPTTPEDGNTKFSLRYDQFEHDLNQWKKDNNLPKDAQRPTIPQRNAGESAVDFLRRVDEYRKQMALWKTAPTYEQHLLSDDTALGEFNRELQRGSVLKRIAFQDSMLAIRKAQEAIMKEVGVDRLNMAEDAYTAENRSHGKGKNEFEEYNNEFLQPLRKAYHQMKKILGDSYDNVRIYMMAKHGLERDAQIAFKKSLDADFEDVAQRSAAYRAYKGDMNRITNDSDLEFGRVDFTTWRQRDSALRTKYSPSYMDFRYDENGAVNDYSGLSKLFGGSDFEEAAHKLVRDIESNHVAEVQDLWNATNAATKKILRDGYKAGMMSKDTYQYVRDMYSHYIPLRGWDGTTADQVWDYVGGGKGAFNQTLKTAHGRTSIADDPIAYIENMAESGILLNNKNWVKQHLMLLAQNHPTSLLTLSKAWYVKSVDDNGNEEWIPATPQITSQMNSNQVKAAIDAFEKKMEQMAQTGDATQKRDGLNIAYPQTHSEEREHEVRVMKDGEEYVIYVNGDPQLAQAMNNTRAHRVREIQSGKLDRAAAWLGRKMAAAYTSLSPLFIPSNYFRDLTMTLASTAIREDAKYNYLLRKNLATSWNLGFMLRDFQNGKLRDKVNNGNATPKEQMFYDFMMNGGETGFVSSLDVEDLKKKFKNDLKDLDRWKANPVKVGHTIMDSIEFLNRAIEDSNRFAVYMTSIQYGRSIDEAVNDAKDVTLNFNRKGTGEHGWQTIRNLYLFINPAVQSLQTLGALAKHHPFKFTAVTASWLASGVLVPIVNVALMQLGAAFLGGDGDDKDWYKDISKKYWQFTKWDRRNNFIMWVPTTHEFVKIPLAQEFRAFYGVGDMIASKMMGGELAEESWEDYGWDLVGQVVDMLPLDPTGYDGNIAVSLMPNAIRPVFELAFNVDFTGKPLFKDTEYNKYDPNFTKAYVGTPDWLVRASKMVNSIGNDYPDVQQNSIDAFGDPRYNLNNPGVVDHVLSSYLGGAYTMGSQVLGLLTKSLNDPKEIKVADIPLVSKFVSNPDDRPVTKKQGDEFWNMKENHDRAANTLSKLKKQAKVDGDYSMLERFYGSEEYKQYKQDDVKVKKYEEDKKKERADESGEEYRPHKLNAEDIYKAHATPKDDFEDLKLEQLYTKLNGFKTSYDLLVDTAPSQSDGYYNTNKAAIDAIDEISIEKQEISELKKGFLDEGKDAYNAEDMKQIRDLRKKILAVLEKSNKVVVANQKAKTEK